MKLIPDCLYGDDDTVELAPRDTAGRIMIDLTMPGVPQGMPRARSSARMFYNKAKKKMQAFATTYTDKASPAVQYKGQLTSLMLRRRPDDWDADADAFVMGYIAAFPRPKSLPKKVPDWTPCTTKPDKDNIEKLILDAGNKILWADDARVYAGIQLKLIAPIDVDPALRIVIVPWDKRRSVMPLLSFQTAFEAFLDGLYNSGESE